MRLLLPAAFVLVIAYNILLPRDDRGQLVEYAFAPIALTAQGLVLPAWHKPIHVVVITDEVGGNAIGGQARESGFGWARGFANDFYQSLVEKTGATKLQPLCGTGATRASDRDCWHSDAAALPSSVSAGESVTEL